MHIDVQANFLSDQSIRVTVGLSVLQDSATNQKYSNLIEDLDG